MGAQWKAKGRADAAATKGRNVSEAQLDDIAARVEECVRLSGSIVTSARVGLAVLDAG